MIISDKKLCEISDSWKTKETLIKPFINGSIKSKKQIINNCLTEKIEEIDIGLLSFGVSSFGYDVRLSEQNFKIFSPIDGSEINPKDFNPKNLFISELKTDDQGSQYFILPANHYGLGLTVETFNLPKNITGICLCKSTYARCGVIINTTVLEAGWKGRLVVEIYNAANLPVRLYANEGIAQILFFESDQDCQISYDDRQGKYQNQKDLILAKI